MTVELTVVPPREDPKEEQHVSLPTSITGEEARLKANGYLTKHVGMFFGATSPLFLPLDKPVWQLTIFFQRYGIGPVQLAFLDVDAETGQVIPLTDAQIQRTQGRARAFAKGSPPRTNP